jgi:general secretion pathway protein A
MRTVLTGAPLYLTYFGLAEAPFSSTPDQRFIYLSDRHRDGLAHLLYGVAERGGFVQLTGEVGTGKTTLCRYLLEHLPGHVDVALILNPTMTRLELLATMCQELRAEYPVGSSSVKALVDALYAHLLKAHANNRRTVVIVDEAQHLSAGVLEQLRLLTNLETETTKLLQIILIGQPELIELLKRTNLRQVAQRVAARYHLAPLKEHETRAYVVHRLTVAGQPGEVFDERALGAVHRASGGVPRLINIICDRALLGAYAARSERVTRAIVRRAAREVAGELPVARERRRRRIAVAAAGVVAAVAATAAAIAVVPSARWQAMLRAPSPSTQVASAAVPAPVAAPAPAPPPEASPSIKTLLDEARLPTDADTAYATVTARWGKSYERRGTEQPCDAVRRAGLACLVRRGTWSVVRQFDVPVVLEVASPTGARHFLALTSLDKAHGTLAFGPHLEKVSIADFEEEWDGTFVVLWKPPRAALEPIVPGARGGDVAWLRERLAMLDGQSPAPASAARVYDGALTARVVAFQRAHRLAADGIAGAETLAVLTARVDPNAPSLARPRPGL